MTGDTNHYAKLGLPQGATEDEIKRAYHLIARRLHPDVNSEQGANELFLRLKEAYEVLSDPRQRFHYDAVLPKEHQTPSPVRVTTQFSRSTLTFIDENQIIYALMGIHLSPDESLETNRPHPMNVVIILDKSTSMSGARLDIVKTTTIELLRLLRPDDIVSIVAFNDKAEVILPAISREKPLNFESRIHSLRASGGTELYQGLQKGFIEIQKNVSSHYSNHIILLTDGRTYGDDDACLRIAKNAAVLGIGITTIGIGSSWNDKLLDTIATRTGGYTEYISNDINIRALLKKRFIGLRQNIIERVTLVFDSKPGVSVNFAFRLSPDIGVLESSSPIRLGSIPGKQMLQIILELEVDPIPDETLEFVLLEGDVCFDIPSNQFPAKKYPIYLKRKVSDTPDVDPPPDDIYLAMSRLTLYRMQDKVKQDLTQGDIEKATQRIHNLSTRLLTHGNLALAKIVLQETQNIQNNHELSLAGEKEIKYGTRGLLLPFRSQRHD